MKIAHADKKALAARALLDAHPSPSGWWRSFCPFCPILLGKPDRKRAFSILVAEGAYHCFRCGTSGRLDNIPAELIASAPVENPEAVKEATRPPACFLPLWEDPGSSAIILKPARDYLHKRGLSPSLIAEARIGACADGRYFGRVVVPVLSDDGESWLGWVGRAWVKKSQVPYLYPRGMRRGEITYNHVALTRETEEPAYVVEGVFDALALWPDAVALLGKPSAPQIEALINARRPIAIVLDGDAWAEGAALAYRLRIDGQRAGSIKLPPRVDPDEVPRHWLHDQALACLSAQGGWV